MGKSKVNLSGLLSYMTEEKINLSDVNGSEGMPKASQASWEWSASERNSWSWSDQSWTN
jgi:hypothetical protein